MPCRQLDQGQRIIDEQRRIEGVDIHTDVVPHHPIERARASQRLGDGGDVGHPGGQLRLGGEEHPFLGGLHIGIERLDDRRQLLAALGPHVGTQGHRPQGVMPEAAAAGDDRHAHGMGGGDAAPGSPEVGAHRAGQNQGLGVVLREEGAQLVGGQRRPQIGDP